MRVNCWVWEIVSWALNRRREGVQSEYRIWAPMGNTYWAASGNLSIRDIVWLGSHNQLVLYNINLFFEQFNNTISHYIPTVQLKSYAPNGNLLTKMSLITWSLLRRELKLEIIVLLKRWREKEINKWWTDQITFEFLVTLLLCDECWFI